jgi:hypothetical protein
MVVSSVMRPTGPLPPRVYWTRRLLLLLVLVLLTALVWWLVGGAGSASETGGRASGRHNASSAPATPASTSPPTKPRTHKQHRAREGASGSAASEGSSPSTGTEPGQTHPTKSDEQPKQDKTPLAQPTGPCQPADVDIEIDVADSEPGEPNTATFLFTSTRSAACTLAITPDDMVVRITSGDDVVWSSDDCPDALRAKELVARADPPTAYEFRWSGHRSSENCQPVSTLPDPGGYWVEAALIGADPHRAYFDIKASKA